MFGQPLWIDNTIVDTAVPGQSPGEGMGNGRATVLRLAEEGAKVLSGGGLQVQ